MNHTKNEKIKLAIVGHGFVGKAVDYGFSHPNVQKQIIDPIYGNSVKDIDPNTDVIFVCVNTPMSTDGTINTTILDSVMDVIKPKPSKISNNHNLIVIKSTITPDVIKKYEDTFVIYNPEFLTEKSANEQFINPQFHILGGYEVAVNEMQYLYENFSLCNACPVYKMTVEEASFVKYTINSFLAMKVTFFNQLYDVVTKTESNFSNIIKAVGNDTRIGHSHTKVPGFDGKKGYGGACFPKDTSAFVKYSNNTLTVLEECIKVNNQYRLQYELDDREKAQNVIYKDVK